MITSTIFDGIFGWIDDKVKIEESFNYKKFCECKQKFLDKLDENMQKEFNDIIYFCQCVYEDLGYNRCVLAQNYGIKIGMELEKFFQSLLT